MGVHQQVSGAEMKTMYNDPIIGFRVCQVGAKTGSVKLRSTSWSNCRRKLFSNC